MEQAVCFLNAARNVSFAYRYFGGARNKKYQLSLWLILFPALVLQALLNSSRFIGAGFAFTGEQSNRTSVARTLRPASTGGVSNH
jgi:hypothetical protein